MLSSWEKTNYRAAISGGDQYASSFYGSHFGSGHDLFNGLLFSSILGGSAFSIFRSQKLGFEYRNVAQDLEAWHLHFQRSQILSAYHHHTQQICAAFSQWKSSLFAKVCIIQKWNQLKILVHFAKVENVEVVKKFYITFYLSDWQSEPAVKWICRISPWTSKIVRFTSGAVSNFMIRTKNCTEIFGMGTFFRRLLLEIYCKLIQIETKLLLSHWSIFSHFIIIRLSHKRPLSKPLYLM